MSIDISKFIRCVRSKPQLWNKMDPMYRNMELKNMLWKQVAQELGGNAGAMELKQKWHNLRDVFRRELKIVRDMKLGKKKRRWTYYDDMLFLSSHIGSDDRYSLRETSRISRMPKRNSEVSSGDSWEDVAKALRSDSTEDVAIPIKTEAPDGDVMKDELCSNIPYFSEGECECTKEGVNRKGRNETESREVELITNEEQCSNAPYFNDEESERMEEVMIHESRNKAFSVNDDYHFAMSIVPHLQQVPVHKKLKTRIKILEVITEQSSYGDVL